MCQDDRFARGICARHRCRIFNVYVVLQAWAGTPDRLLSSFFICDTRAVSRHANRTCPVIRLTICFSSMFSREKAGLRGMRYAPNVRRAQGTKKETGYEED